MTAMLHCLVGDIAAEIRAAVPRGWFGANDDSGGIVEVLTRAGLLDEPELMALVLRRADEERIGTACRARSGRRDSRAIQALVSSDNGAVSAAAMALILARGRRRDRFGQCLVAFDDLSLQSAGRLANAIAAASRSEVAAAKGPAAADAELSGAAAELVERHDPSRGVDALTRTLAATLDEGGGLTDEFLLSCAQEGEVGLLGEAFARRAGISGHVAFDELLSGDASRAMMLLRIGGASRELSAGLLASIGDLLGVTDPGAAIGVFDRMTAEEIQEGAAWLRAASAYRSALERLGIANG